MKSLTLLATLGLLFGSSQAHAGPYTDDLSKCLVSSTTDADKSLLVKWIFTAIALNKEISPYIKMDPGVRARINKDTADLYMRLLTDSCKVQTHDAFKYEGQASIGSAFQVLGQVASQGMFADPGVAAGMSDMTKYLDEKKLDAVLKEK
jgi:hypothetical protein